MDNKGKTQEMEGKKMQDGDVPRGSVRQRYEECSRKLKQFTRMCRERPRQHAET